MEYDPNIPKSLYDSSGEKEWTRLTRNRLGELLFHVHMDIARSHITHDKDVLELGAGAGIFTKELVKLGKSLSVSDISPKQLSLNEQNMRQLGLHQAIRRFELLDITNLGVLNTDSFDVVFCVGGALNYTLDKEKIAIREMLRVLRNGGVLILGVLSLISAVIRAMSAVIAERQKFGIEATRWLLDTGIQDAEHYPVESKHYIHMMRAQDIDALLQGERIRVVERRSAGLLALAGEECLERAKMDKELWNLLLEREIAWSKRPETLDCGANIIYVIKKIGATH